MQHREPHLEWALPQLLCAPGQRTAPLWPQSPLSKSSLGQSQEVSEVPTAPTCSNILGKWLWLSALALQAEALAWQAAAHSWHIVLGACLGAGQLACGVRDLPRGIQQGLGGHGKPQTPSCLLYYDPVLGAGDVGEFQLLSRNREWACSSL